ncbi:MAG: sulfotransferase family protein [Rhodobacteraceae bacterium]|nr:sulfotransferase family protein [Paracoccaceae bacterium]
MTSSAFRIETRALAGDKRETDARIFLWATPRSISTALERVMKNADGLDVLHEPFTDTYYFSSKRRSRRYGDPAVPAQDPVEADAVNARLEEAGRRGPVFIKDLAFQAEPYVTDALLATARNIFLTRDPLKVYASLIRIKPDFTEDEFGFTALERIWNRVHALQGAAIALDGEEFRADPHAIAYKLCVWSDVRYSPDMLTWEDGRIRDWAPHEELSQAKWHETLEKSRRILPPAAETPVRVDPAHREMVTRAQEIYRRLTADRIRPDPI